MKRFKNFYEAWKFLNEHQYFDYYDKKCPFNDFNNLLYIEVVKVNPITKRIHDYYKFNSLTNVWLEAMCWYEHKETNFVHQHDIDLDVGADTFENAIIKLANKVYKKYGRVKNDNNI